MGLDRLDHPDWSAGLDRLDHSVGSRVSRGEGIYSQTIPSSSLSLYQAYSASLPL